MFSDVFDDACLSLGIDGCKDNSLYPGKNGRIENLCKICLKQGSASYGMRGLQDVFFEYPNMDVGIANINC